MYKTQITERAPLRLFGQSHTGPYMDLGPAFAQVAEMAGKAGLWPHAIGMAGVYYDNPKLTAPDDLRSFPAVAVREGAVLPDGMEQRILDAGPYLELLHAGDYAGLAATYGYIYDEALPASGRTHAPLPSYELYLNNPEEVPPEELQTLICIPLNP
jgi:AraC family transcriptional regulator